MEKYENKNWHLIYKFNNSIIHDSFEYFYEH